MSALPIDKVSYRYFDRYGSKLVAEMSELRSFDLFQRMFDDAADVGFMLEDIYGNCTRYYYIHTVQRDGDILYWEFATLDRNDVIIVYND